MVAGKQYVSRPYAPHAFSNLCFWTSRSKERQLYVVMARVVSVGFLAGGIPRHGHGCSCAAVAGKTSLLNVFTRGWFSTV